MVVDTKPLIVPRRGLVGEILGNGNETLTSSNISYVPATVLYQKNIMSGNGTNSNVTFDHSWIEATGTISITLSTNTIAAGTATPFAWRQASTGDAPNLIYIWRDGANIQVSIGNQTQIDTGVDYVVGKKINIIISWSGGNYQVYINNSKVIDSTYGTSTSSGSSSNLFNFANIAQWFAGEIGAFRVYNVILNNSERKALVAEKDRQLGQPGYASSLLSRFDNIWDFNGDATNITGNGNDGTVSGSVTLTSDRFGITNQAYNFPGGSGDIISTTTNIDTTQDFGIHYYIKVDALQIGSGMDLFTTKPAQGNNFIGGATVSSVDRIDFLWRSTSSIRASWSSVTSEIIGKYGLLSFQKEGSTIKIYWNGVQKASATVSGSAQNSNIFNMGGDDFDWLDGTIDWVGLSSNSISSDELKAISQLLETKYIYPWEKSSTVNLQKDLVLHLNGNNNGTLFYDQSGIGNDGTQFGGVSSERVMQHKPMILDGSNDGIDVTGVSIGASVDIAMAFVIQVNGLTDNYLIDSLSGRYILSMTDPFSSSNVAVQFYDGSTWQSLGFTVTVGEKYQMGLNIDKTANTATLYVDGVKKGTITIANDNAIGGTTIIGANYLKNDRFVNCLLDDFRMYKRLLQPEEHQYLTYKNYFNY